MGILCPTCNKLVELVSVEKSKNVTVNTYSCGHKRIIIDIDEKITVEESLKIKVKDEKGKKVLDSKIENQVEHRFSRKPSGGAIQLIFKEGKIVHIHCKVCQNEWKIGDEVPLDQKFSITPTQESIWKITCKKCRRQYSSG